ncbi:hypothetical protein [Sphingosinicella terrae]|jgi:hypothetical protein|uniref:hypothetical protein n=1 Tax=Sphingosinicella terrae TaxID=2172047 RepID=UPI0013B3D6D5|nr:hypothetical protein [Sphingosinicella terrae]
MAADDMEYLEQRAEAEIAMAQQATHVRVAQAHFQMANAYLDRMYGEDPRVGPNPLES